MKNNFKVILGCVIIGGLVIGSGFGFVLSPKGTSSKGSIGNIIKKDNVKVVKNEASKIDYENYDNGLISLKIPKGWKVEIPTFDYIHYSFKVYNPANPNYMFLFGMKLEGFNKSQSAKDWQVSYYPNMLFAQLPVVDPHNTEGFYKTWNETAAYVNANDAKFEYLPQFADFNVLENLGSNPIGGDILRATFSYNNKKNQGLFTASVMDPGSYFVNSNVFDFNSEKIDVSPLNVYNIIFMMAPDEDFNDWNGILDNCLSTLQFSDTFVNGFNSQEKSIMANFKANQAIYDSISDGIMDSWEKRNHSYDIISQKQSDATLGYERVYDTDTGEIYKAYNGFMDDYDGTRYQSITDDMYTEKTSGYIEK